MRAGVRAPVVCLLVAGLTIATRSLADEGKLACIAAYEEGQRSRNKGDLLQALEHFAFCDNPQCPVAMHGDCEQWLSQVQASIPTVIFRAVDATGFALPGAQVSLDGRSARLLDGRALAINPGQHDVIVERAGYRPVRRAILVSEGEKLAQHDFMLTPVKAPPAPRSRPLLAVVLTSAVGVLGGAGFAYFGLKARSGDTQLDSCAPFCDRSAVEDVKRDYLVANISLVAGLVGVVTSGILLLIPADKGGARDPSGPRAAVFDLSPGAAGFSQAY